MKVSVELGDDVLRVIDDLSSRSGRPRDEIIAEAVRQQALRQGAATKVLSDLLAGRDDGLSDDDAAAIVEAERELKAEMRPDPPTGLRVCADPEDDYLFALAVAANVEVVVSGDRKVQAVQLPGIEVLKPREIVNRLNDLIANPHPWGPTFLAAPAGEPMLIAEIRGNDKVLRAAAMFCTQVQRWTRRRYLKLLVTPEALPSIHRHRRQVAALLRDRGMANFVDYPAPDVATVKMTEDPGYTVRNTDEVLIQAVPIQLHRRPQLPHLPETGGWRVHHVGDPSRTEPGYIPPRSV
jgi:predicted transcriptional regulator